MKIPPSPLTRRSFLARGGAGLATVSFLPASVLGLRGADSPNSKLNIAAIGLNNQGNSDLQGMKSENIVALCDVDTQGTDKVGKQFQKAKHYRDYRKMLDEMDKEVDAVLIATPDHWHAVMALHAMKMGKHVYCEKPLAHSVREIRALSKAARERKVTTQLGNQGHSFDTTRVFREWVEDGAIGTVREVHAMCRSVYSRVDLLDEVKQGRPVPETLDWDMWIGPAQFRPYHPTYHPGKWRCWTRFGTGVIGDWVCHVVDPVYWALDLDAPTTIQAMEPADYDVAKQGETFPKDNVIKFGFPAKGNRPAVTLTWYDGAQKPPRPEEFGPEDKLPDIGAVVVGDKGKIRYGSHGASALEIFPEPDPQKFPRQVRRYPRSPGHQKEWIDACKAGKPAGSDFMYGGKLTEIALLGVIAMRFRGKELHWDTAAGRFTNTPEANAYLEPMFREGWSI